jgi:hypothetical protein
VDTGTVSAGQRRGRQRRVRARQGRQRCRGRRAGIIIRYHRHGQGRGRKRGRWQGGRGGGGHEEDTRVEVGKEGGPCGAELLNHRPPGTRHKPSRKTRSLRRRRGRGGGAAQQTWRPPAAPARRGARGEGGWTATTMTASGDRRRGRQPRRGTAQLRSLAHRHGPNIMRSINSKVLLTLHGRGPRTSTVILMTWSCR